MIPGRKYTPELILQTAWRRKWFILVPAIAIAVGVAAWTHRLQDQFRSDVIILVVPQRVPEQYVRSTVTTTVAERLQSISQQILSRTRLERIILDFNLYSEERKTGIMEDIVDAMRGQIEMRPVQGDTFRVGFISQDPRTAMRVTERLGSLFIDESLRDREVLAEGTSQFLEAQLEDARRQLIDNEKKLEDYRRRNNGEMPAQLEANMQGMHNTEMQLQSLTDSLNRDRDRHLVLERTIADVDLTDVPLNPAALAARPETAADRLRKAEDELRSMLLRLKPEHPDVVRARRTIAELRAAAEAEEASRPVSADLTPALSPAEQFRRSRINDAKQELANLDREVGAKTEEEKRLRGVLLEYQQRIEATPTRQSELVDLTRDYGTLQSMYQNLLAKKQESQISANLERRQIGEQFRILDPARLPARPFTPDRPRFYAMGIFAGLGVGLALAGLLEYFDRTMRSEEDVMAALGLPVLASVPLIITAGASRRRIYLAASAAAAGAIAVALFVALRYLR